MALCCLSINVAVIYPSQKPRSTPRLPLPLSRPAHLVNPFYFSPSCFQIHPRVSTFHMAAAKTTLTSHPDQGIRPPVFPPVLPSGNQGNLPKPQIPSHHSQCPAFLLDPYCPWNSMTPKALHILDPGPTFLSFPAFFSMLLSHIFAIS